MDATLPADGEILALKVWIFELGGRKRVVVDFGILIAALLKLNNSSLKYVNLVYCPRECETERINRTLQSLKEINLHHRDKYFFTAFLRESAEDRVEILISDFVRQVGPEITCRVV